MLHDFLQFMSIFTLPPYWAPLGCSNTPWGFVLTVPCFENFSSGTRLSRFFFCFMSSLKCHLLKKAFHELPIWCCLSPSHSLSYYPGVPFLDSLLLSQIIFFIYLFFFCINLNQNVSFLEMWIFVFSFCLLNLPIINSNV